MSSLYGHSGLQYPTDSVLYLTTFRAFGDVPNTPIPDVEAYREVVKASNSDRVMFEFYGYPRRAVPAEKAEPLVKKLLREIAAGKWR